MAEQKTKPTKASVHSFLNAVPDPQRRADAFHLLEIMKEITAEPPKMWGATMVGFGHFHYVYASGHEGDTFLAGFAPRKDALTVYFLASLQERFPSELQKLGKAKANKGCLHIKNLANVDLAVLREMIRANVTDLIARKKPPSEPASTKRRRKKQ